MAAPSIVWSAAAAGTRAPGNATNMTSSFASMNSLTGGIGFVAVVTIVLLGLSYAASSVERYQRLQWLVSSVARLLELAAYGLGGTVVLAMVALPVYYVASQPAATRGEWLTYAGYAVAAFVGLAAFGWVVERLVTALKTRHAEFSGADRKTEPDREPVADGGER